MKICMFTNTYHPHVGGVARSVQFFAEDLIRLGHRVLIVAPSFGEDSDVAEASVDVVRVPAIQNFNGSDFSVRIPLPFVIDQQINKFEADIVHSHHPFLLGDTAVRVAYKRGLPLVFTHHTRYEQYLHYVPLDSDNMKQFVIRLATMYANLCSQVVAPSGSIARMLERRGVKRPIEDIPTGVDVSFFAAGKGGDFRRRCHIPENATVIGHLGRLAPEKNLPFLVEAVASAIHVRPEVHFMVVGKGPSEAIINRIFTERRMSDRLHLIGEATGGRLRDAYKAMDIFVFASTSETQGMVLVEAMAAGIPVIALDAPGSREVVIDGKNGRLLAENASTDDFAEAIRNVLTSPESADAMISKARLTAERFSRKACAQKMEALYQRVQQNEAAHTAGAPADFGPLDFLTDRIKTEWELWRRKAAAALEAVQNGSG